MTEFEYSPIRRPLIDSRAIQGLVRQDVVSGDFPNPNSLGNPNSLLMVLRQRKKVLALPDNYTGVYSKGRMAAFMKTAEWGIADEMPFATEEEKEALRELYENGMRSAPANKLGVFGLVITNRLPDEAHEEITERLLDMATDRALSMGKSAVDIVFHNEDPVSSAAGGRGFEFTGRMGVAAGAPGLSQRLYSKPLDT